MFNPFLTPNIYPNHQTSYQFHKIYTNPSLKLTHFHQSHNMTPTTQKKAPSKKATTTKASRSQPQEPVEHPTIYVQRFIS